MMCEQRELIRTPDGYDLPLDIYVPKVTREVDKGRTRRPAIVICPGGGFSFLSEREAEPIALSYAAAGINAFVVWYRCAPNRYPLPMQDAARAIAYVRKNAERFATDPERVSIIGFSAGGYTAASVGIRWHEEQLWTSVGLKPEEIRPTGMILSYPVITGGKYAHRGSFLQLTGSDDLKLHESLSLENYVTEKAVPTFLWHTWTDGSVPVQNSLRLMTELRENNVSCEAHLFPEGGHGLSLANEITGAVQPECQQWVALSVRWLKNLHK